MFLTDQRAQEVNWSGERVYKRATSFDTRHHLGKKEKQAALRVGAEEI
jgi:hypothetical protein